MIGYFTTQDIVVRNSDRPWINDELSHTVFTEYNVDYDLVFQQYMKTERENSTNENLEPTV